jgi:hypothetical protein
MLENWIPLYDHIGKTGSEGEIIKIDDELPGLSRVTIEQKFSPEPLEDHFTITTGVYGLLVHTIFIKNGRMQ